MGIKKSSALAMMAFAMSMEAGMSLTEQGSVNTSKKKIIPITPELRPFNKQEGILNLIKDYNLIKKGESKKGKRKQIRIINKIEQMITKGYLTEKDLN